MDKTPQQLDPKLKEAYDRVMGTVITPPQPDAHTQQAPLPPPPVHSEPVASPPVTEHPVDHPAATVMASSPTTQVDKTAAGKKRKGVSPFIIFLGIVVFVAVYAVVWIKYFGMKVPFLNP